MRKPDPTDQINWRPIPFVRLLIPFLIGIITAFYFPEKQANSPILLAILFFFIGGLYFFVRKFAWDWLMGGLIFLFLLLFGNGITHQYSNVNHLDHFGPFLKKSNEIIGVINSDPSQGKWTKFNLEINQLSSDQQSFKSKDGQLLVYLPFNVESSELDYGDQIYLNASVLKIEGPKNPEAFDYKAYLANKNIHHHAFVKEDNWRLIQKGQGNPLLSIAFQSRKKLVNILQDYLGTHNELAVAAALILGYKDFLTDEIQRVYSQTGAMHVLAVSGLHVGLVSYIIYLLLGLVRIRARVWKITKVLILLLSIWGFAFITGAAPSVLRAAVMFSFLIIGKSLNRDSSIYNTLAASAFVLLCFNPFLLKEVGFQLSYLAIIGIVFFHPYIYKLFYFENKITDYFWNLSAVSIAAQLTTLPLSLFYFNQIPFFFWLSGLIVVPAATLILSLGCLLFLFHATIPFVAKAIGAVLYYLIYGMNAILNLIDNIPFSVYKGIWITLTQCAVLYLLLAFVMYVVQTKNRRFHFYSLGIGILFFALGNFNYLKNQQRQSLVIYHINKKTMIDFIDGKKVYRLQDTNMDQKNIDYTSKRYLWSRNIREEILIKKANEAQTQQNLFSYKNYFQFFNEQLVIIDDTQKEITKSPKSQRILLTNNTSTDLTELLTHHPIKEVIFDASNSDYKIEQWKKACRKLGLGYYNIKENGAYILDLTVNN